MGTKAEKWAGQIVAARDLKVPSFNYDDGLFNCVVGEIAGEPVLQVRDYHMPAANMPAFIAWLQETFIEETE